MLVSDCPQHGQSIGLQVRRWPIAALPAEHWSQWAGLQRANVALDSPYFSPEYAQAVGAVRGDAEVGVHFENGEPAAFLPFHRGALGVGRPLGLHLSDFQAVITAADRQLDCPAFLRGCGLHGFDFDHLLSTQPGFTPFIARTADSPYVDLSAGYGAYEHARGQRSAVLVKLAKQAQRTARELGPLRFEFHHSQPGLLKTLIAWKTQQYRETRVHNPLREAWTTALLDRLLHTRTDTFAGVLSGLYVGDKPIALHLGMRSTTVLHYWFPAYDPAYARHSPGLLLLAEIVRTAPSHGINKIDLGKGDSPYKQRFMTGSTVVGEGTATISAPIRWLRGCINHTMAVVRGRPLRWALRRPARWIRDLTRRQAGPQAR